MTLQLPFKGHVIKTFHDILGDIRINFTYLGAPKIKELTRRTTFIKVFEHKKRIFTRS